MLINIVIFYVELIKLLLTMRGIINRKIKFSIPSAVMMILCTLYLVIMEMRSSEYKMTLLVLTVMPICAFMLEGKKNLLFCIFSYLGICTLDDLICIVASRVFSISKEQISSNPVIFFLMNSLNLMFLMIITVLMRKFYYSKHNDMDEVFEKYDSSYIILFIIGQAISLIVVSPFITMGFSSNLHNNRIIAICMALFGLFLLIFGFIFVYNNSLMNHYKQIANISDHLIKVKDEYYQTLLKNDESLRNFRHDINNHVICIGALIDSGKIDEAIAYLSSMSEALAVTKQKYQTGNILVNAIVNDIYEKHPDVSLEWEGIVPAKLNMSEIDVCIIFSNVLENAITAASKCSDRKDVNVTIKHFTRNLVITVVNTKIGDVKEKNGRFITTKKDRINHGIGIMNVRRSVASSGGTAEFVCDENSFKVEIILPDMITDIK